jgi:hypothetical protein
MRPLIHSALMLLFAVACAHTKDEELTAAQHRNEAKVHTAQANAARSKYELEADDLRKVPRPIGDPAYEWNSRSYNPSAQHLDDADRQMRAASEHLRAARRLEAFEDAKCREIAPAERAACPLLASWVSKVTETQQGVLLELKPDIDAVDTHRRLDCHLAYATAQGFTRPSCPLFVKGMLISLVLDADKRSIAMTADDAKVAAEIRAQARRIFYVEPAVSTR